METKKKIVFFLVTTLLLGTITFLIIRNMDNKETPEEKGDDEPAVTEAKMEEIDYEKYMELRSQAHETETYALLLWDSSQEVSTNFYKEVKGAFQNKKSVVYTLDVKGLSEEDFSRVIDDATDVMKYKTPTFVAPTIFIMSKGQIVYKHDGFIYKEELMDNLNAKSIE